MIKQYWFKNKEPGSNQTMNLAKNFTGVSSAVILAWAGMASLSSAAHADGIARVTNGNDAGQGSLRQALEIHKASRIFIPKTVGEIEILSTLNYTGEDSLTIFGSGQTIKSNQNVTLLALTQGADLRISNLDFEGPGGFSISQRGDLGTPAGKGIFIDVRDNQTGVVNLVLKNVSVSGVANHGIHVSDCSLADDCGAGSGGGGEGSAASVSVVLNGVSVDDAGNGKFDADGLRVDDRGAGGISLVARHSSFTRVGADGVELDEGDQGRVFVDVEHSDFSNNGGYCDPDLLEAFLPDPAEASFAESDKVSEADIPGEVAGSPDDSCFEREVLFYDSGFVALYEFGIDLDDGIDLDEAGEGSLIASMRHSTIDGNLDEGVDFDEAGGGYAWVRFLHSSATGNRDDGFKVSEEDEGGVIGDLRHVVSSDNGGKGAVFEEASEGDLFVNVVKASTSDNGDGVNTGIEAVQETPGVGKIRVRNSSIGDGLELSGVDEI